MTSSTLPGFPPLTEEQQAILNTCPAPQQYFTKGQLTRVTAAAGAGKTTTLLALAVHAAQQGHTHLSYVTFTRAAATDGKDRLQAALRQTHTASVTMEARTLHSFAMQLLQQEELPDGTPRSAPWSDKQIMAWISKTCRREVLHFLRPCWSMLRNDRDDVRAKKLGEQVVFFIYKSLLHFCRSEWTLDKYKGKSFFGRDYYPAKQFHAAGKRGEELGFPPHVYDHSGESGYGFYARQAARLWEIAVRDGIPSYDFSMKLAQLKQLRVPGTILLVDESQDMDACQVDWISKQQVEFGTHVFVVGDAAQAIYSFRGAKPQFLMDLQSDHDLMLTDCWRFGPAISNIANLVLFAKEHSGQTGFTYHGRYKNWIPYRTKPGFPNKEGLVTTEKLSPQWSSLKVTIIARTNANLMIEALDVLGFAFTQDACAGDDDESIRDEPHPLNDPTQDAAPDDIPTMSQSDESDSGGKDEEEKDDETQLPKIHINGKGENSGLKLWKKTFELIEALFDLFMRSSEEQRSTMTLVDRMFPEFARRQMDWDSFCKECQDKELTQYSNGILVVSLYKERTMEAVKLFEKHVMEKHVSAEEADVILTTCHAAKGMEWDHVQVCNDFIDCATFKPKPAARLPGLCGSARKRARVMESWEFGFQDWGDDVNLLYVACTRAKRSLSVPPCLCKALDSMDKLHDWYLSIESGVNSVGVTVAGCDKVLSPEQAGALYETLVRPLRAECKATDDEFLTHKLIKSPCQQ